MERAQRSRNYQWILTVLGVTVAVLGVFIFYSFSTIQTYRAESQRQTLRGLAFIGQDISDNLANLRTVLENLLPWPAVADSAQDAAMGPDFAKELDARDRLYLTFAQTLSMSNAWDVWKNTTDKFDDLHKTFAYRGLDASPRSRECDVANDLIITAFKTTLALLDCRRLRPIPIGVIGALGKDDKAWLICTAVDPCYGPRFTASLPIESLVDFSHVRGLVEGVLIADAQGSVLYQTENQTLGSLTSIASLIAPTNAPPATGQQPRGNAVAGANADRQQRSSVFDAELSGARYTFFIQPEVLPLPTAGGAAISEGAVFYVVGVKKAPSALETLNQLPLKIAGAAAGFVVILLVLLPIIKLGLIGADEKLRVSDAFFYFTSLVLVGSGLTLLVLDLAAYSGIREQASQTARAIASQIQTQFNDELDASLRELRSALNDPYGVFCEEGACSQFRQIRNVEDPLGRDEYPPYEIASAADQKGRPVRTANGDRRAVTYRQRVDPTESSANRAYFQAVRDGKLWRLTPRGAPEGAVSEEENCSQQFFLERIRSRSTGGKFSVLSVPANCPGDKLESGNPRTEARVAFMIKTFLTFRAPVLPPFFDFAVFDEATGQVLHHSDERRSLLENFYAEFQDGERLKSAAQYRHSTELDGTYLGRSRRLFLQPLDALPWSIAVLYDKEALLTINFEIVAISFAIMVGFAFLATCVLALNRHRVCWGSAFEQSHRTADYVWLSLVFLSHASFILFAIQFVEGPAFAALISGPLLVVPLLYLTFRDEPEYVTPKVATVLAAILLALDLLLSLWLLVHVLGQGDAASLLAIPLYGFSIFLLLDGLLVRLRGRKPMLPIVDFIVRKRHVGHGNRRAYYGLGLSLLVLVSIVPTVGVFEEMFRVHMDNLGAYGRALLLERYIERYKALQGDAARLDASYGTAGARLIQLPPEREASGIYASLNNLFPAAFGPADFASWDKVKPRSIEPLYTPANVTQADRCARASVNGQLTAGLASLVPAFDETSESLHLFLPNLFSAAFDSNCSDADTGESIAAFTGLPHDGLTWITLIIISAISAVVLYFLLRFAAIWFFASNIAYMEPRTENDAERFDALLKAIGENLGQVQFIIGMPYRCLDELQNALNRTLAGSQAYEFIRESCVAEANQGDQRSDKMSSEKTVLILTDMHLAFDSNAKLNKLLELLEARSERKLPTIVLSDIYPLEAIVSRDQYPDFAKPQADTVSEETSRWVRLLATASTLHWPVSHLRKSANVLERETQAFPELHDIRQSIMRSPQWKHDLADTRILEPVRQQARGFYASLWRLCSRKERVLLYRLAHGSLINPANASDITNLLQRGILRRDPVIRLPNESFRQFILTAETPDRIDDWAGESRASLWSIVRIPLALLIILILLSVAYMIGTDIILGLLGAAAAVAPLLLRLLGALTATQGASAAK